MVTPARWVMLGCAAAAIGCGGAARREAVAPLRQTAPPEPSPPEPLPPEPLPPERAAPPARDPRVVQLTVMVPEGARVAGLLVTLDGAVLAAEDWDKRRPTRAGTYTVSAAAPGKRAWFRRVELRADEVIWVPVLEPSCPARQWWHEGRCQELPASPDIVFGNWDAHAGFLALADQRGPTDSEGAGLGGLGLRLGHAVPFGFVGGLDLDLGGSFEGDLYLDLHARLGPAYAITPWLLIGATTGGGVSAITDDRLPAAFELPAELLLLVGLSPDFGQVYLEASARQSWLFGDERRKRGSNLPWVDALRTGLRLGIQTAGRGLPIVLSVVTQGAYMELMSRRGAVFTVGFGGMFFYGEDRYLPVVRAY